MTQRASIDAGRPLLSRSLALIFCCFFLSGATGLMYEVVWRRLFGVVFGETAYALTAVLAAFMGGLALGSAAIARLLPRVRDPLRAYGWIELGVALSAATTPVLFTAVAAVSGPLQRGLGLSSASVGVVELVSISMVLVVPTALMGATLPLLIQAIASDGTPLGRPLSVLYAINTFGAVVGAGAAGYLLLPALGNRLTLAAGVAANIAVGLVVIGYTRARSGAAVSAAASARPARAPAGAARPASPAVAVSLVAVAATGGLTMIYEIAWSRALALVIGSSTYAFSAMLVVFLAGIAAGSALYAWLLAPRAATPATFAALQVALGLAGIAGLAMYEEMPGLFLGALTWSASVPFVRLVQFAIAAMALLPTALLCGAAFPCAVAMSARTTVPGEHVGRLYAVNTVGAVAGAALGGLVVLPGVGVHGSLKAGIVGNLVIAVAMVTLTRRQRGRWRGAMIGAAALGVLALGLLPAWDPRVLSSGPAIYVAAYRAQAAGRSFDAMVRGQKVLFYRDGPTSSVSVNRDGQHTFLRINGKTDAGTGDMATQMLLGHLPLMFQGDQPRVLVIGLGSGITAGAVAAHPVERIDVVEIEPAVVEAARFFAHANNDVLRDPRVRLVIGDARHFVRTRPDRYDVIISEPSNPWISSVSELFTVEFFRLARERLGPGGTMVQWIHGYNLFADDLRMVMKTFRTVFPSTTVWEPVPGDYLLLGRTETAPHDIARARARFTANPAVRRDLQRLGVQAWPGLFGFLLLGEADTARFAEPARLNTDDRLPLEFSAPRALYADTTAENMRLIRSVRREGERPLNGVAELETPEAHYWIGMTYLNRRLVADARAEFQRALGRDPSYAPAMLAMALTQVMMGNPASVVGAVGLPPTGAGGAGPAGAARQ